MSPFDVALLLAAVLCSLVAGFLFAFAAVVMPGIASLDDRAFVRTFQVIDRVIKKGQPLFALVWVGSILAIVAAAGLGIGALRGLDRLLLLGATLLHLLGVQLPTLTINVPLNDRLQQLGAATTGEAEARRARESFESLWNRWNVVRTVCATAVSILLALLLARR